jgi:hypothetical protein
MRRKNVATVSFSVVTVMMMMMMLLQMMVHAAAGMDADAGTIGDDETTDPTNVLKILYCAS